MYNADIYIPNDFNDIFKSSKQIEDLLIDKEYILKRISQEEVFEFLLQQPIQLRGKVTNTIRGESRSSVSFIYTINDKLIGTDWVDKSYKGDCFVWANIYYHKQKQVLQRQIDFYNTSPTSEQYLKAKSILDKMKGKSIYELLAADLGIKGSPILNRNEFNNKEHKKYKLITRIELDGYINDKGVIYPDYVLNWLSLFYQNKSTAKRFGLIAAKRVVFSKVYIEIESRTATVSVSEVFKETPSDFIIAYYFAKNKYKIYRPFADPSYKWRTNHSIVDDFGMNKECKELVLTKSRKDRMVINTLGDQSYSFSSESEMSVEDIKVNTKYVLYDNDYEKEDSKNPGLQSAIKIITSYNKKVKDKEIKDWDKRTPLKMLFIPSEYKCTDIAEVICKEGAYTTKKLYKELKANAINVD